jgi:hypothetical protein
VRTYIDEDVNPRIARFLHGHTFGTPNSQGWKGLQNGQLLAKLAGEFDALLTHDGNLEFQQNLSKTNLRIIVLEMTGRQLSDYEAIASEVEIGLQKANPGSIHRVRITPAS